MTINPMSVWIGFDPRETAAFMVARESIRQFDRSIPVAAVRLRQLQEAGLYTRPMSRRLGKLWDEISVAHMATEFAITRFLVPELVRRQGDAVRGWALFMDCDVLLRTNLYELKALLDDSKAVMCVKHDHRITVTPYPLRSDCLTPPRSFTLSRGLLRASSCGDRLPP